MILVFKVITAPVLVYCLTMLSRRYGAAVAGVLMGIPLLTGPISIFMTLDHGFAFAQHAAVTTLVGQTSTCLFCLCYAITARRLNCLASLLVSLLAFFAATFTWNQFSWTAGTALGVLLAVIILLSVILQPVSLDSAARVIPRFDLPLRMIISTIFILIITALTNLLGPQLSGLITPFPVFVLILAAFTHVQSGGAAAANLVRGIIIGSLSFAMFFAIVAMTLAPWGAVATYGAATFSSLGISAVVYLVTHRGSQRRRRVLADAI